MGATKAVLAARKLLSTKKVIKFGAAASVGAAFGGYTGAVMYGDPATREYSGARAAWSAVGTTLALTGAVLARKQIGTFVAAGAKALGKSAAKSGKVSFRRVRGRIVPIRG